MNGKGKKVVRLIIDYFILQEAVVFCCFNMDLEEHSNIIVIIRGNEYFCMYIVLPSIIDNPAVTRYKRKLSSSLDPSFVYICRFGDPGTDLLTTKENIILVYETESVGNECKDKFSKMKSSIYTFKNDIFTKTKI